MQFLSRISKGFLAKRQLSVWVLAAALISLTSCDETFFNAGKKKYNPPINAQFAFYDANPFAQSATYGPQLTAALNQVNIQNGLNEDTLWSLANCRCTQGYARKYLLGMAVKSGVLPQALVPSIREQIRNNPLLQALLQSNSGTPIGDLIQAFGSMFTSDSAISEKIRTKTDEKLAASLPGGSTLSTTIKYNFDLFADPTTPTTGYGAKAFTLGPHTSKWSYIFSMGQFWEGGQPLYNDHGLQLISTAKVAAEWAYLFGLDKSTTNEVYGGLSFNAKAGITDKLDKYDPRTSTGAPPRTMSGIYTVNFPANTTVIDLALKTRESWTRNPDVVTLNEQARLWSAAALAFDRLRPSKRGLVNQAFIPEQGILPDEVYQLPLIFLSGMGELLKGAFITEDKDHYLLQYASVPGTPGDKAKVFADLKSSARLARAINGWLQVTEDMSGDRLNPDTFQRVSGSRDKLKDALRVSIQSIFMNNVQYGIAGTRLNAIGLVKSRGNLVPAEMDEVAEALAALSSADLTTFSNPGSIELRNKIVGLYHWFAAEYLADLAEGNNRHVVSAAAIFWTLRALENFSKYPPEVARAPWLADALKKTQEAVAAWDLSNGM